MKNIFPPILLLLMISIASSCGLPQSPYRNALPATATGITEHRSGVVDFTYLLRARITREEFATYVSGLQLVRQPSSTSPSPVRRNREDPDWWQPVSTTEEAWELRQDGDIIRAGYRDGYLYLSVVHL